MKRSEINAAQRAAQDLLVAQGWHLPLWASWSEAERRAHPETTQALQAHQMGWDVTDFGSGAFAQRGLTLFCLRNGRLDDPEGRRYAEKLLMIGEGQETPAHRHFAKSEDIINRGGGRLVLEFSAATAEGRLRTMPVTVSVDGVLHRLEQWQPLELAPGQSVTIPRGLFHRFYAKPGHGPVLGGEVSDVNDDRSDNDFLEPLGRFTEVIEDAAPLWPLWNEETALAPHPN